MSDRYIFERIIEIISFVVNERHGDVRLSGNDLSELSERGYTDGEISAAISWIIERQDMNQSLESDASPSSGTSFRILHGIEAETIDPEAWGLLLGYRDMGFLTNEDIEGIVERAVILGAETGSVGLEEIKALIAAFMLNQQPLPMAGSRSMLLGNETVN